MGEPAFRAAMRELEAEKQRKINELIKAEALKEERARAAAQPSADPDLSDDPTPRKEADEQADSEELDEMDEAEADPEPTEKPNLTPEQIKKIKLDFLAEQGIYPYGKPEPEPEPVKKPAPKPVKNSTSESIKKVMVTLHGELADWLTWKRREGYTLSIFCERCMEKAMLKDADWKHYKENGDES